MNRKGFSLLEVGLAIGVTALTVAGMLHVQTDSSDSIKANAAADQLVQIQQAAQIYVNENFNTLYVPETSGTTNTLQVSDLVNAGLLPQGFNPSNVYGQTIQVQLTRGTQQINGVSVPVENGLVVTTNGVTIDDKNLGRIMARIGAGGGAYLSNPPPGVTPGTILGYGNGWSVSAADYPSVKQGHAVATLNFGANSTQFGDQLYRNYLGPTELNTMHTLIDANGNNIVNLGALRFTPSIASSASSCQEPTSGQTEENLMSAAGTPCFVYDGSTDWLTNNGNGVSNGLLVGQSPGNNAAIAGQSLGMTPNGIQFYNGAAGSAGSPNANYIGGLSMLPANGNTIYTTANGLTQGGVALNTAGGDFSTSSEAAYNGNPNLWGSITGNNFYSDQGSIFIANQNHPTHQFESGIPDNLALQLSYNSGAGDQGGYATFYDAAGYPVVQMGDDGSANGHVVLRNSANTTVASLSTQSSAGNLVINDTAGANAVQLSVGGDGSGSVSVYNNLDNLTKSIATLQETVNKGGQVALQGPTSNANIATLGDDGNGVGQLALNTGLGGKLAQGGYNYNTANGAGYLDTLALGTVVTQMSDDVNGNGQITVNDSTGIAEVQSGVKTGGYMDIYNAVHGFAGSLSATASGNGDLSLYNNQAFKIGELGNSGDNTGMLSLNDSGGTTRLQLDAAANGNGSGRIMVFNNIGNQVLTAQGNAGGNGSIALSDANSSQRVLMDVTTLDNGELAISNSAGANVTLNSVSSAAYQPTLHSGLLGQVINALTGRFQSTGSVGVGTSTTGAPNAELYESGNNGYLYTSGGIDDPCFNSQNGALLMSCSLNTNGNNITTELGSSTYYGNLAVGNVNVANGYNVTLQNGDLIINSGGIKDPCFNDTSGAFNVNCAASLGSTLAVSGLSTLNGGLNVNGATNLNGNTAITGTLTVSQLATLNGGLTVTGGLTQLKDGLTVTGGVTDVSQNGINSKCFNDTSGTFAVNGNCPAATFGNGLNVTNGLTQLQGGLTVTDGVTDVHSSGIYSKCFNDTTGTLDIGCGIDVAGGNNITLENGDLIIKHGGISDPCFNDTSGVVNFTCTVNGTLNVTNLDVSGTETVTGVLYANGGISSKCFNDTSGGFSVTCDATFGGDVTINGHMSDDCFSDKPPVGGAAVFTVGCQASFSQGLSVSGGVTYLQDGLTVTGGVTDVSQLGINSKCFNDNTANGFVLDGNCGAHFNGGFTVVGGTDFNGNLEMSSGNIQVDNGTIKDNCFNDANSLFAVQGCSMTISNGSQGGGNTGRLGVMGYGTTGDNVSFPSGWGGGIATYDLYAHGSIGVGGGGTPAIAMTQDADGNGLFYLNSSPSAGSKNLAIMGANASTNYGGFLTLNNAAGGVVATLASDSSSNGQLYLNDSGGGRVAEITVDTSAMTTPELLGLSLTHKGVVGADTGYIVSNGLVGVGSDLSSPNAYFYEDAYGSGGGAYVNGDIYANDNVMAGGTVGLLDGNGNAIAYFQSNGGEGNLKVQGTSFLNNVSATGTFNSKCITDNGSLTLGCGTTVNGTLSVPNNSVTFGAGLSVGGGVNVTGGTVSDSLTVTGTGNVYGNFAVGNTTQSSTASVFGSMFVFDTSSPLGSTYQNTFINGEEITTQTLSASTEVSTHGSVQAVDNGSKQPAAGIVLASDAVIATSSAGAGAFCPTSGACAQMNGGTGEFDGVGIFNNDTSLSYCPTGYYGFAFDSSGEPALCKSGTIHHIATTD